MPLSLSTLKLPGHRGRGGEVQVGELKEHSHPGREMDNLAAHQTQLLAVVQHRVEVLNPGGIRWAVQDDPLPLLAGEDMS